jgi:serine/threonine protein kinase
MPAPSTSEELLELVRKSGVLDEKRLDAYLEKIRAVSGLPKEPGRVAGLLLRDGLLTGFQAEQFLQGKWRRFTIGKYKVLERIASGGMGSVYLCEHKFMRRRAAVKVLPTAKATDPSSLERFYREARAVAALDHPNIVRAYDIDQEENLHFLVMEFVDGSSLQEIIKQSGPLDPIRSAHYIGQAALGLQHAHEVAGLVHRDIKPGNLIVDRSGTVKILDMGLARFFHDEDDLLTQKYDENVLGTADYLAPEQALDSHGVDIRADIYSLGATFYFCLTGRTPFNEGTVAQKLIWHQTRQPKPIKSLRPEVPAGMAAVLEKMMAKDPAQRYQEPREVVQALAPWTKGTIAPPAAAEMPQETSVGYPRDAGPRASLDVKADVNARMAAPRPVAPATVAAPQLVLPSPSPVPRGASAQAPGPAGFDAPFGAPNASAEANSAPEPEENWFAPPQTGTSTAAAEDDSLCWERLAPDTQEVYAQADTDPRGLKKPSGRKLRGGRLSNLTDLDRRRLLWVIGCVAGALLLGLVVTLALAFWGDSPRKDSRAKDAGARTRLVVNRSGEKSAFPRIADALRAARPGSHIVVQDDFIEEQLELSETRMVTIETDGGKPVIWRCPEKPTDGKRLIFVSKVDRVQLRGFTFDGRDLVEEIFLLFGECPGLTLEHVSLQGFKRYGILVANCAGRQDLPVSFQDLHLSTYKEADAGLAFELNPKITSPKLNQYFTIQNCRFDGSYKSALHVDPGALKDVNWKSNRVHPKSGPAVELKPPQ